MVDYYLHCANGRKNKMIHAHPLLAYRAMFATAEQEMCIFTGDRDKAYQRDMLAGAVEFLARPGRYLRLACQCPACDINNCEIVQGILQAVGRLGRVTVHRADRYKDLAYLMIADRRAYCFDGGGRAEINYGNPAAAARWQRDFDHITEQSPVVIDDFGAGVQ